MKKFIVLHWPELSQGIGVGIGIFVLYSMQDWSNWSFELANNMIYQIAAFAWLVFGALLVWFALGDLRESRNG